MFRIREGKFPSLILFLYTCTYNKMISDQGGTKMFLIFNKDKIQTYIVSVLTVAVLIVVANIGKIKTIETSATAKLLPIYNVQTEENKIAFTMNCAW